MGCGSSSITIDTRGPIYIYYGTTSGNSSRLAFQFADEVIQHKFIPKGIHSLFQVINLSEFNPEQLKASRINVFFISTYGQGGPTNDAADFKDWIMSEDRTQDFLLGTSFIVFGLGSTNHAHFCGMAEKVNQRLEYMGGKQLHCLGRGNAAEESTDNDYLKWVNEGLHDVLEKNFPLMTMEQDQLELSVYKVKESKSEDAKLENLQFHAQKYQDSPLVVIKELKELKKNHSRGNSTLYFDFEVDFPYQSAQNIAIYPENTDKSVAELCEVLRLNPKMTFEIITKGKQPFPNPISLHNYLKKFCNFLGPVSKKLLYELSQLCVNLDDKEYLKLASTYQGREQFDEQFIQKRETLLTLLRKYKIHNLKLQQLIELCPLIAPRFFTIGSSNLKYPKNIHIMASELAINEERLGLCSDYFRTLKQGDKIRCFLQDSAFKHPKNDQIPVLMIGIGAGLAPMLALIQDKDEYIEKDQLDKSPFKGPLKLYFGCRSQDDFLFKEELINYEGNGTLSELKVAFSREGEKIYVTKYLQQYQSLADHIDMGGIIYLCGSTKMGKDISNEIENMYKQVKKVMPYLAFRKVVELEQAGQLIKELWG